MPKDDPRDIPGRSRIWECPHSPGAGPGTFRRLGRSRGCRWKRELLNAAGADSARAGLPNFPRAFSRSYNSRAERSRRCPSHGEEFPGICRGETDPERGKRRFARKTPQNPSGTEAGMVPRDGISREKGPAGVGEVIPEGEGEGKGDFRTKRPKIGVGRG